MNIPDQPCKIARQALVDMAIFTDPDVDSAWPLYATESEDKNKDQSAAVVDSVGTSDGRLMHGDLSDHFGLMFHIRGSKDAGWSKANQLRVAIADITSREVYVDSNHYLIHEFCRIGQINPLGKETGTSMRWIYTLNCQITITLIGA